LGNRVDVAMKRSRFSEQQIAFILHQAEEGVAVEVCRKAGISIQTYYRWRKKYGGLMPSEMKRLKLLEEELRWKSPKRKVSAKRREDRVVAAAAKCLADLN
jgi:putative transposase